MLGRGQPICTPNPRLSAQAEYSGDRMPASLRLFTNRRPYKEAIDLLSGKAGDLLIFKSLGSIPRFTHISQVNVANVCNSDFYGRESQRDCLIAFKLRVLTGASSFCYCGNIYSCVCACQSARLRLFSLNSVRRIDASSRPLVSARYWSIVFFVTNSTRLSPYQLWTGLDPPARDRSYLFDSYVFLVIEYNYAFLSEEFQPCLVVVRRSRTLASLSTFEFYRSARWHILVNAEHQEYLDSLIRDWTSMNGKFNELLKQLENLVIGPIRLGDHGRINISELRVLLERVLGISTST